MDADTRTQLIGRYKQGYSRVLESLSDVSDEELDHQNAAAEWTPREIVHHLADSEMTSAIRLRRLLAEDRPEISGYNEQEFASRLHYDRPIDESLEALRGARLSTGSLLDRLSEEDWKREGTHSEIGLYTVEMWLLIYAAHAHDHADQIERAREASKAR